MFGHVEDFVLLCSDDILEVAADGSDRALAWPLNEGRDVV